MSVEKKSTTAPSDHKAGLLPPNKATRAVRWISILSLIFLALFGDHVIGHFYFKHLCAQDSGTKIFRVVPKVDGFWWSVIGDERIATQYGYAFVEGGVYRDKADRYVVNDEGKVDSFKSVKSISRYVVYSKYSKLFNGMFGKGETIIEDAVTHELLAVETEFAYRSGWLLRSVFSSAFSTVVAHCPKQREGFEKIIVNVLIPINAKE